MVYISVSSKGSKFLLNHSRKDCTNNAYFSLMPDTSVEWSFVKIISNILINVLVARKKAAYKSITISDFTCIVFFHEI
jgi:hypothetical protein